jgi:hypothetical protein
MPSFDKPVSLPRRCGVQRQRDILFGLPVTLTRAAAHCGGEALVIPIDPPSDNNEKFLILLFPFLGWKMVSFLHGST